MTGLKAVLISFPCLTIFDIFSLSFVNEGLY